LLRAEELLRLYDRLPAPHIPIAADQYAAAFVDARVLRRTTASIRSPKQISLLDLNDSVVIGRDLRRLVGRYIETLEALHGAIEELAWFEPPVPEVDRAREAMISTGRYATEIATCVLRILTAPAITDAEPHYQRFDQLLSGYPYADDVDAARQALETLPWGDLDRRVSLALGADVIATDAAGLLDPARVFTAFATDDDPYGPLARAAVRYFGHLTELDAETVGPEAAALAMPALALASLDRPLVAHRVAREAADLVRRARALDQAAVDALLERTVGEGPRVFAAAKRIHDDVMYLASGSARDADDVVRRVVSTYKTLAESSFRTYAWLVADAQEIIDGSAPAVRSTPPLLGELEDMFAVRDDALSKVLASAAKRSLRNAEAHEDYRFDAKTEQLVVGGKRIPLSRLDKRVERLIGVALGLDAAFGCLLIEFGHEGVPEWLPSGQAPFAEELLIRGMLYSRGLELVALEDGDDLKLVVDGETDPAGALPALAAIAAFVRHRNLVLRRAETGDVLVEVERAAFDEFAAADEAVKDLAMFAPFYSAGLLAGRPADDLLEEVIALFVGLIAAIDVPRLTIALGIGNRQPFTDLQARLAYIVRFAEERNPNARVREVVRSLREGKLMIPLVLRGDNHPLQRLIAALHRTAVWSDKRGYRWPLL
jgi:hypothetical protein